MLFDNIIQEIELLLIIFSVVGGAIWYFRSLRETINDRFDALDRAIKHNEELADSGLKNLSKEHAHHDMVLHRQIEDINKSLKDLRVDNNANSEWIRSIARLLEKDLDRSSEIKTELGKILTKLEK